ncbi:MAG TPA: flap endonuclease-1 [Candidatus Nanoarchaeia archaeon]|nr:flap endonuclease-1 [Candidatus Nanoarchaeia archaeon]
MGVDFKSLVVKHETSFKELSAKMLGIDSFNWLYQFLSIIRQPDGTPLMDSKGRVTSHLTGLFYRTVSLLEAGIRPCYIFDGPPPAFKKVVAARIERREKAKEAYEIAKREGNTERAHSMAMQSTRLTSDMVLDAKRLVSAFGLPIIEAPSEGEAQASYMTKKGDLFAAATQDYDTLLFGSPRVVRNLSVTGKRRMYGRMITVNPEIILLDEVLKSNGLSQDSLIMLGILVGTDYNPGGVKGIGPKTALKLVKEYGVDAWKHVDHEWDISPTELLSFFKSPPVTDNYSLSFSAPSASKIKAILVDEYEFSAERVDSSLKKIKSLSQSGLSNFF